MLLKEAIFAIWAKNGYHDFTNLIFLQTNNLRLVWIPQQVDYLWRERTFYWHIETEWELVAVISVILDAEAVVYQQEFVGSFAIAVEDLLTRLNCPSVYVNYIKVCLIFRLCRF